MEAMEADDKLEVESSREYPLAAEEWLASRVLECIADPRAVCRLALVNKTFCAASASDSVWLKLLPPSTILNPLLAHVNFHPPSKKHLYIYLCHSITYHQGLKKFWLDPTTGGECHMISARALSIIWGDTPQYWEWKPYPGSMFSEVACLHAVCWFEVTGTFKNVFRPGRYIVSFRLQLHSTQGWQGVPVKLCVQNTTYAHPPHESQVLFDGSAFKIRPCHLSSMGAEFPKQAVPDGEGLAKPCGGTSSKGGVDTRGKSEIGDEMQGKMKEETQSLCSPDTQHTCDVDCQEDKQGQHSSFFKKVWAFAPRPRFAKSINLQLGGNSKADGIPRVWVECDVGEFFVEDDNENRPIEVNFSMREIDVGFWKGGLFLDGVIIRPSYVIDKIVNNDEKKTLPV